MAFMPTMRYMKVCTSSPNSPANVSISMHSPGMVGKFSLNSLSRSPQLTTTVDICRYTIKAGKRLRSANGVRPVSRQDYYSLPCKLTREQGLLSATSGNPSRKMTSGL